MKVPDDGRSQLETPKFSTEFGFPDIYNWKIKFEYLLVAASVYFRYIMNLVELCSITSVTGFCSCFLYVVFNLILSFNSNTSLFYTLNAQNVSE